MSLIINLSDEIILNILRNLENRDIACCAQVNRRFRRLTSDNSLYRELQLIDNLHISAFAFQRCISQHCTHIETIVLTNCYWIPASSLANALQHCQNLRVAILTGSNLSVTGLNQLLDNNPNLRKLGWSLPNTPIEKDIYTVQRNPTEIGKTLKENLCKIESLSLHFQSLHNLLVFITLTSSLKLSELSLLFSRNEFFFLDGHEFTFKVTCGVRCPSEFCHIPNYNTLFIFNRMQTLQDSLLLYLSNALQTNSISVLHTPGRYNAAAWSQVTREPSTINTVTSVNMDCFYLTPDIISWVGKLTNLTHLSLAHTTDFKSNLMRNIGINSPHLQCLNLFCSEDWIDEDLCGLLSIANHCKEIKELNIGGVHYHSKVGSRNLLFKILSTMHTLTALSISACCCVSLETACPGQGSSSSSSSTPSPLSKRGTRISFADTGYHRTINVDTNTEVASRTDSTRVSGLQELVQSLKNLTQLEIIDKRCINSRMEVGKHGFDSSLSVSICPYTRKLRDQDFFPISSWTNLTKLTLAGLPSVGPFKSLVAITANCTRLEFLSLSHIGLPGHSGTLLSLSQAISHCQQLRMLRLNQPYYSLNGKLLESLCHCTKIEGICIISKEGKVCRDQVAYNNLFDSCPRLAVFQLFCGETLKKCKNIEKNLIKRYKKERPPLSVVVATYPELQCGERLQDLPIVHAATLTRFQTRVAEVT